MRRWLEQGWYGRAPRPALLPLAAIYGGVVALRAWLYRRGVLPATHPGVPTIVVGNLTVGGTGKTPLVIWLATRLRERDRKPGVVLRGYGGTQRGPRRVRPGDDPREVGDEAVLIAQRSGCAVAIGANRAAAAKLLVGDGCDIIIADDGLQHRALRRDLEVLVIDGERGFGNGALLPAGPLRERPRLARFAGLLVVHGDDHQGVAPPGIPALRMRLQARPPRRLVDDGESRLEDLRAARVHALAGIGHPRRFFDLLRVIGADPVEHPLPDHHQFQPADLGFEDGLPIVMTEKDAVKCRRLAGGRDGLFYLPVAAELPQADAARLLDRVLVIGS